jgi:hypothetical protein
MFLGLAVLAEQYTWAERWVKPVRLRALKGAADSVATWPRIVLSTAFALALIACGVLWVVSPDEPSWWPVDAGLWLPGGLWTGVTQVASGILALVLIGYSYRRFHGKPEAVAALQGEIGHADEDRQHAQKSS